MPNTRIFVLIFLSTFCIFVFVESAVCEMLTLYQVQMLPDDAFAVIETTGEGQRIRHCPHHDHEGNLDPNLLIYSLGTFREETFLQPEYADTARKHLMKHYDRFISKIRETELDDSLNINRAPLDELIRLPYVGPVLAVNIDRYRKSHSFESIKDILHVEGIGQAIYNAVRHYIRVD